MTRSTHNESLLVRIGSIIVCSNEGAVVVTDIGRGSTELHIVHTLVQTHDHSADIRIHVLQTGNVGLAVVLHSVALDSNRFQFVIDALFSNHVGVFVIRLILQIAGRSIRRTTWNGKVVNAT